MERSECLDDCIGTTSNVILHLICLKNNFNCILRIVFSRGSTLMILLIGLPMQFRAAIRLQYDFHRAIYNLGTVLVSLQLIFPYLRYHDFIFVNLFLFSIQYIGWHKIFHCLTLVQIEWSIYPKFVVSFFAVWISRGHIKKWGIRQC